MKIKKQNKRLVMTLLVRDEEDIVEDNICFHLNSGVDHIIVTDNGSVDGTKKILNKYKKMGFLTIIEEPSQTFEQDKWVSRMASIAIDKYKADYLIHCDADEFWFSKFGNLKKNLNMYGDLAFVSVINYLPPFIFGNSCLNFNYFKYTVESGTEVCPVKYEDRNPNKYLLYSRNHPKIITSDKYRRIAYGNHMVKTKKNIEKIFVDDIHIHHFPIRSYNHFLKKVANGGSAYEKNPLNDRDIGWHWRKWYEIYKNGNLKNAYKELCLYGKIDNYLKKNVIKYSLVPKRVKFSKEIFLFKRIFASIIK